jgi:hypothetical protein
MPLMCCLLKLALTVVQRTHILDYQYYSTKQRIPLLRKDALFPRKTLQKAFRTYSKTKSDL